MKVYNNQKDSSLCKTNGTDPLVKNLAGNYIIIKHKNDEYSFLEHLKQNSMVVKENEEVKRGQKSHYVEIQEILQSLIFTFKYKIERVLFFLQEYQFALKIYK